MFNRKRKPLTEQERDYILFVKSFGCVCCVQLSNSDPFETCQVVEFNHHIEGGRRVGNNVGTGECEWHHRGEPKNGWTKSSMLVNFGPSRVYQGSKGAFAARFGTDEELRQRQEDMLNGCS